MTADDGGLSSSLTSTYYARAQNQVGGAADANSISLYDTREHAMAGGTVGLITFTDPIETTTAFYVPEDLVENPENLDVMNWVLNQNFQLQLAVGQAPLATNSATTTQVPASTSHDNVGSVPTSTDTTAETVTFGTDPGWATATLVRVDADGGGLSAANNYYVRNLGGGVYSFYNSVANANAGGTTGRSNLNVRGRSPLVSSGRVVVETIHESQRHLYVLLTLSERVTRPTVDTESTLKARMSPAFRVVVQPVSVVS